MSDPMPIDRPRARGPRTGVLVALVLLAFVAGLILMGYAMRNFDRSDARTATQAPVQTAAAPATPAQPAPLADPATLATREAALAGQLAALEARTAALDADTNAAGRQATRAEALLVAFAARRALDRGQPLGYLEEQLRTRFGAVEPRAVGTVIAVASRPVTLEALRQGLDTLASQLSVDDSQGWWEGVRQELAGLVVLRQANSPSTAPVDRLTRARHLLDAGQVDAARDEIARMPGAARATTWDRAAYRYAAARRALDTLENAALMTPPAAPPAAPAPQAAPPVTTTTEASGTRA
ncbi:hypothetical protein [Sphingomonas carotinifaciens]|uniref:Inner membrane protein n=1 Tax=Sphingomonas carotinifaciens TaxID=1166323 RepID=A0A1G7GT20_9SPHN|nr:hypothetical protein [Sphingomonas carotinifaciens]MBB4086654.1 hypothetical protein [Sphingomonas carotinifaciens]MWC43003.1 hypothetical protein [Sphingomonas carotinifaciens]SDE91290.1 hypothetical protein SAMN05216557_1011014 [Sphingomonas carotinifaciens]